MFVFSDKTYNALKRVVQVILPAISALYFGLASIWDLYEPDKVVGTLAIITTFLGVCLGISNRTYEAMGGGNVGTVVVSEEEDGVKLFSLELDSAPEDIEGKDSVTFKVAKKVAKKAPTVPKKKP